MIPIPDARFIVIGNTLSNDLVFIHAQTAEVLQRTPRIADPYPLGFSPDQKRFVTAARQPPTVSIFSGTTTTAHLGQADRYSKNAELRRVHAGQHTDQLAADELASQQNALVGLVGTRHPPPAYETANRAPDPPATGTSPIKGAARSTGQFLVSAGDGVPAVTGGAPSGWDRARRDRRK